jgi:hypothetical protein
MRSRFFSPPHDTVVLTSNDPRLFELAGRLWREDGPSAAAAQAPIEIRIEATEGPEPGFLAERSVIWRLGEDEYELRLGGLLWARMELASARIRGGVSTGVLRTDPALAARFLLEAVPTVFLGRRAFQVLHAGAVVGPRGAVVVRGGSGAGKSTLVAAAWKAGLGVLADETLLVWREDPDELAASVRDLTLLPDSVELLGLAPHATPAFSGGEEKRRVDLFGESSPEKRRARRRATLLLGPRDPGPARLVLLDPESFIAEFAKGEIPQERLGGNPDIVARAWAGREAYRLDGASDLAGAVHLLDLFTSGDGPR